jgi:pimeloyl-ACP methyl ester carboxylesterase
MGCDHSADRQPWARVNPNVGLSVRRRSANIAGVDLFVRESGPVDAPAIVFLHGGLMSGWIWDPVVQQLPHYRCLVPDLPQYGKSFRQGPFDMVGAADAIADLIQARVKARRAHLVGFSLGAQVGVQLLATTPRLIDRALLSSVFVNTAPGVAFTRRLAGMFARSAACRWLLINRHWDKRYAAQHSGYRDDARLNDGPHFAHVAMASSGFTVPNGLDRSDVPTLFVAGSDEFRLTRHSAATLARSMPNGVDRVAIGMSHNWPMRDADLFSHVVSAWLSGVQLPAEISPPTR